MKTASLARPMTYTTGSSPAIIIDFGKLARHENPPPVSTRWREPLNAVSLEMETPSLRSDPKEELRQALAEIRKRIDAQRIVTLLSGAGINMSIATFYRKFGPQLNLNFKDVPMAILVIGILSQEEQKSYRLKVNLMDIFCALQEEGVSHIDQLELTLLLQFVDRFLKGRATTKQLWYGLRWIRGEYLCLIDEPTKAGSNGSLAGMS